MHLTTTNTLFLKTLTQDTERHWIRLFLLSYLVVFSGHHPLPYPVAVRGAVYRRGGIRCPNRHDHGALKDSATTMEGDVAWALYEQGWWYPPTLPVRAMTWTWQKVFGCNRFSLPWAFIWRRSGRVFINSLRLGMLIYDQVPHVHVTHSLVWFKIQNWS